MTLIFFANTAVLLKKFAGEGERVDVQKLFGCIGLFTLAVLWCLGKIKLLVCHIHITHDRYNYIINQMEDHYCKMKYMSPCLKSKNRIQ